MLSRLMLVLALLALLPEVALADSDHPNALEVGAAVATCMRDSRGLAPDQEVTLRGTTQRVTLFDGDVAFATLERQASDPASPSIVLNTLSVEMTPYMRETMRYVAACYGTEYWGKTVPWEETADAHIPCRFEPTPDGLHQYCGDANTAPQANVGGWYECLLTRERDYIRSECRNGYTKWAQITPVGW